MVALLTQCCCGCTLRTGTIIIGVLSVIAGLYFIATNSVALSAIDKADDLTHALDQINKQIKDDRNSGQRDTNSGQRDTNFGERDTNYGQLNFGLRDTHSGQWTFGKRDTRETDRTDDLFKNFKGTVTTLKGYKWFIILSLIVRSIELVLTLVMLAGALLEKPKLLRPWIIFEIIITIIFVIAFGTISVQLAMNGYGWLAFGYVAAVIVGLLLSAYYIYVVYSYYKTSMEENNVSAAGDQKNRF